MLNYFLVHILKGLLVPCRTSLYTEGFHRAFNDFLVWWGTKPCACKPFLIIVIIIGRPILYTTTSQRGWCIEAFISILVQPQSQKSLPGGGGVQNLTSQLCLLVLVSSSSSLSLLLLLRLLLRLLL